MGEWKELKKDDLPPDILTGDYEFQFYDEDYGTWELDGNSVPFIIDELNRGIFKFRYRKKPKPAPTHKDIMTKWWKYRWPHAWVKVIRYEPCKDYPYYVLDGDVVEQVSKKWFVDKKSLDIPPEAE